MKQFLMSAAMLLCIPLLFAATLVQSNSIAQNQGLWSGDTPYHLALTDESRELWGPEGLLWKETVSDGEDGTQIVSRFSPDGESLASHIFREGALREEHTGPISLSYYYGEDGKLERVTTFQDGSFQETQLFAYSASTGALLAVVTVKGKESSIRYFNEKGEQHSFTYADTQGGQTFLTIKGDATITKPFSSEKQDEQLNVIVEDTGSFTVNRTLSDGSVVQEAYNEQGLLVVKKSPSSETEYQYNEENILISEHTVRSDGSEVVSQYEKGALTMVEEREAGRTTSILHFLDDGKRIQTLYSEGRPYCDITYAAGGKRILSISYR
jgi:YD repeat-containing protein